MIEAYKRFFYNYANFNGRSNRADYWWVVLCNLIIGFILGFIGGLLGESALSAMTTISSLYSLATFVPMLALIVRRLHDINKSGWYYLMILIPIAGIFIFLAYMLKESVNEANQYGARVE